MEADTIEQIVMKEKVRKNNKNIFLNSALQQKSHQRN